MFSFLRSKESNARRQARDWLRLAQKIHAYRRDILDEKPRERLESGIEELRGQLKRKAPVEELNRSCEALEPVLRQTGGSFFPRTFWAENVEMVLVAALVVIAIRTFLFQPFKIPTNSMYPTYNGITTKLYLEAEEQPNRAFRAFRTLQLGAGHRSFDAPDSGELLVPLTISGVPSIHPNIRGRPERGRQWFILPGVKAVYTFYIGEDPIELHVPTDFPIEDLVRSLASNGAGITDDPRHGRVLRTGRHFEAGEFAFAFDILTGDQLFVDRMSYHFIRPQVGHPVVFLTDDIELMSHGERGKYYIKRLAGEPGDTLRIEPPALLRNGEPIEGAAAFALNAEQAGEYAGYVRMSAARYGGARPINVPEDHFFVLGDNSPNSADSRQWGFVPKHAMVGRAFFIYYPFSHRWGPSK
ncbi:MAG: signal peptidase I [Opitutales bacterium]|nr:signal peptidase I [Opitutales bacterium]